MMGEGAGLAFEDLLQVLRGKVTLNGHALSAGDGAAISEEGGLEVAGEDDSELMLFDLA